MLNREILQKIKGLYEKDGGWIVSIMEAEGTCRKTVLETDEQLPSKKWEIWKAEAERNGTALCRGDVGSEVFLEAAEKKDRVVICGAGYVGYALARLCVLTGIRTIVIEDRDYFAEKAREAGADLVICRPFEEAIRDLPEEKNTAFVVMTRGHAYDQRCLTAIAGKKAYYVGMMGSRTRAAMMGKELENQGVEAEWIRNLHAPIGLEIGAQTPEEIAVSVLAEILSERTRLGCGRKEGHEVFDRACQKLEKKEKFILATILERKGSAPRKEGTHFIVSESENTFGTIGGGKLEADVKEAAQNMLKSGKETEILHADLNNKDAAEEGLVCGGRVKVLLEAGVFE